MLESNGGYALSSSSTSCSISAYRARLAYDFACNIALEHLKQFQVITKGQIRAATATALYLDSKELQVFMAQSKEH